MIIDVHAHIIPPAALRERQSGQPWWPRVYRDASGVQLIEHGGSTMGAAPRELSDIGRIVAEQDAAGVEIVVLSPPPFVLGYETPAEQGHGICRVQNDAIAKIARERQKRVIGMGIVPLQDPSLAVKEAFRIVGELGLRAIEVGSNVNGTYLGDEKLLPFWEAAAALEVPVLVHPVPGLRVPVMRQFELGNLFGNPSETGLAAASLIFGGVLERYPTLKICLSHGGGVLPYIIGRLDHGYEARMRGSPPILRPPSIYFKQFYFDTLTHSVEALQYLVELVGADHVLLGSDYPFDMGSERPVEVVDRMSLTATERTAILGGNAARLLRLSS
jgi:aminocarboxymuconate-semialdehyde decarboxylase